MIKGEVSTWHKIKSAEIWNFYEGDPMILTIMNPKTKEN